VTVTFQAFTKEFEMNGHSWSTTEGNVFVVDLDPQWQPTVRPVRLKTGATDYRQVLAAFQRALPDDHDIASLHFTE